jgi:hypothetical protein
LFEKFDHGEPYYPIGIGHQDSELG